jgi:hypothetical protein
MLRLWNMVLPEKYLFLSKRRTRNANKTHVCYESRSLGDITMSSLYTLSTDRNLMRNWELAMVSRTGRSRKTVKRLWSTEALGKLSFPWCIVADPKGS